MLRNAWKKPLIRLFLIFLVCNALLCGCGTDYELIRISDKYYTENILGSSDYYREGEFQQRKKRRYYHNRYLLRIDSPSAEAGINNKAVDHAVDGNYQEALILLKQITNPWNGVIANNMAVLYEISGDKEQALQLYLEACRKDKENSFFVSNFNSL